MDVEHSIVRIFRLRRSALVHLVVLVAYALLTVALTYPLAWNIGSALPGEPPDTFLYIWNLDWVRRALFDLQVNPYWTQQMYYPMGVSLYFQSLHLGIDVLALPLQFALGTVRTYMVIALALVIAGGYATYLLAFDLTRRRDAAFFAGFLFTFSPYRFAHLAYSHLDLMPLAGIPLAVLATKKLLDRPGLGRLTSAIVLLFWVSLTDWYYALYSFILIGIYLFYRWARTRSWQLLGTGLVLIGVTLGLLSPWLVPMIQEKDDYPASFRGLDEADKFSADLLGFVTPSSSQSLWGQMVAPLATRLLGGPAERTLFIGYSTLALVIFAVYRRRGAELYFWMGAALLFFVLSLGPYLHIASNSHLLPGGGRIPLPFALLYNIPGLGVILTVARSISRFGLMVMLGCSLIAAMGLAELLARFRPRIGYALAGLACAVAGVEFLVVPLPITAATIPPSVQQLAADISTSAVLDLPPDYKTGGEAMYYSTIDGRPTTNGYHARLVPFPLFNGMPSMRSALDAPEPDDILLAPRPAPAQVLAFFGVRYIALHKQTAGKDLTDQSRLWIKQAFGNLSPIADDASLTVYLAPSVPPPPFVVAFGNGWYEPEAVPDGRLLRWMLNDGQLLLYARNPCRVDLAVDVFALGRPRRSRFYLNGAEVLGARVPNEDIRHLMIANLALRPGRNELVIHSIEPAELPAAFNINDDPRAFTIAFARLQITESSDSSGSNSP
ncbi:MAG: hypothetical protein WCF84_25235 [Anaerolineae bacterium]